MKRAWFIVWGGLFAAVAAYACIYIADTAAQHAASKNDKPALAWMQWEYRLTDAQFAHVRALHDAYQPKCVEMCRKIDEKNAHLQKLLAETNALTPEITQALAEAMRVRMECQTAMLEHFYEVARVMPRDQGKRYLT